MNNVLLEKYNSHRVRKVYENTLKHVETIFPQYIDELRGIAAGSKVSFFKVRRIFFLIKKSHKKRKNIEKKTLFFSAFFTSH